MLARSWIAALLLVNYLLVVGMGCISRPEDQHELVLVQTSDYGQQYQECRYLRLDGLEAFMNEALASRYQSAPDTPPHHLLTIIYGIDAHHLPDLVWLLPVVVYRPVVVPVVSSQSVTRSGINRIVYLLPG